MTNTSAPTNSEPIFGVEVKALKSHADDRGFFREIVRCTDSLFQGDKFGQWSHSKMVRNVVKAWHYHHVQTDWWYVPIGKVECVLFDNREESPTYRTKMVLTIGDARTYGADVQEVCIKIPTGVLHGCRVLSEEAHLFYITSEVYNPQDEGRIPFDSESVPHVWGPEALTVENDRRYFTPSNPRQTLF